MQTLAWAIFVVVTLSLSLLVCTLSADAWHWWKGRRAKQKQALRDFIAHRYRNYDGPTVEPNPPLPIGYREWQ